MPPIVFASNRSGPYRLFAVGDAGGKPVPITDGPSMYPSWSPDGTSLVFVGETDRGRDAEPAEHEHAGDAAEAGSTGRRMVLSLVEREGRIVQLLEGAQVPSHPTVRGDGTVSYQSTLLDASEAAGVNGRSSIDTVDVGERRQRTVITNRGPEGTDPRTRSSDTWLLRLMRSLVRRRVATTCMAPRCGGCSVRAR